MKPYILSIHIFRSDLRLADNTALIAALKKSERVIPVYISDENTNSEFPFGKSSINFFLNTLQELDFELRGCGSYLYLFNGNSIDILSRLITELNIDAVFVNRDYSPYYLNFDERIAGLCKDKKADFISYGDSLLSEPESVLKTDGKPYQIFTPFFKKVRLLSIPLPVDNNYKNYFSEDVERSISVNEFKEKNFNAGFKGYLNGGREEGLKLLENIETLSEYNKTRDFPSITGTSLLSAHHRIGSVSIRESYHKICNIFSEDHPLIRSLFWRDFFNHISYHFPYVFNQSFNLKYEKIEWDTDETLFEKWCKGETGFPIVDAGMKELNNTGYMHNRVRMIVASLLVKDFHIDWKKGERYFAEKLIDYDPSINNGNWQWVASTGCDAQPYFRIFNPWTQQKKFDSDCIYIRKWIPELKDLSNKEIHNPERKYIENINYPLPVVNHQEEAFISKSIFSKIF